MNEHITFSTFSALLFLSLTALLLILFCSLLIVFVQNISKYDMIDKFIVRRRYTMFVDVVIAEFHHNSILYVVLYMY